MPNAKVLSEKQAVVAELIERFKAAGSGLFVDYKGITVAEDTALRAELRRSEIDYTVIKNTLCRRAIDEVGLSEIDPILNGTTSLATTTGDPIAPFRIIGDYAKKLGDDRFNVKAAFMEGQVLSVSDIAELSALSSKEALYARVLGTMLAPITSLAVVLGQIVENGGGSAAAPKAESAAEAPAEEAAPAEAPAEEAAPVEEAISEAPAEEAAPVEEAAPAEEAPTVETPAEAPESTSAEVTEEAAPEAPAQAAAEEPAAE